MTVLPEMPCAKLVERVTDYLEGALDVEDRARLEDHLAVCPHCVRYLRQLQETVRLTGKLREQDISAPMRAKLLAIFSRWRHEP